MQGFCLCDKIPKTRNPGEILKFKNPALKKKVIKFLSLFKILGSLFGFF